VSLIPIRPGAQSGAGRPAAPAAESARSDAMRNRELLLCAAREIV